MKDARILVGVTGSIAAYKAVELVRRLSARGADVRVAMTPSAQRFVQPLTFAAVTQRAVLTSLWDGAGEIEHVEGAHDVDAMLIAPASANTIARLVAGMADDIVLATALSTQAPLIIAPAMESGMWENAATRHNIGVLRARGVTIVEPEDGHLASGRSGVGRLADLDRIADVLAASFRPNDLAGLNVVITAGPTHERIDPVRVLSNRSTGAMGIEIARAARDRGADVTLILGPTHLAPPEGITVRRVESALDMLAAGESVIATADIVVAAAAVSDFRPATARDAKLKRTDAYAGQLELVENPDVIATLAGRKHASATIVGFAAETENIEANARRKLDRKGCDLVIGNLVGPGVGFGEGQTEVLAVRRGRDAVPFGPGNKAEVADFVLDQVFALRGQHGR